MVSIAAFAHYGKGMVRILPFLLGTLIGYAVAVILTYVARQGLAKGRDHFSA